MCADGSNLTIGTIFSGGKVEAENELARMNVPVGQLFDDPVSVDEVSAYPGLILAEQQKLTYLRAVCTVAGHTR